MPALGTTVLDFGATPVRESAFTLRDAAFARQEHAEVYVMVEPTADNDLTAHKEAGAFIRFICEPAGLGTMDLHASVLYGLVTGTFNVRYVADGIAPATLWVDPVFGDDSRSKATVTASDGSLPWATIGRALWGSSTRSSPNSGEAAAAGDVVSIAGGTYNFSSAVNDRQTPVYNPANSGTSTSPIVVRAAGPVILRGPSANAPAIGSYQRNYVRWSATTSGSWQITCDATGTPDGGTDGTSASGSVWNTKPDTGPVVIWDCTGVRVDGLVLDGGVQADYADNYNGIRVENATDFVIRHCTISSFRHASFDNHNGSCITIYGGRNGLVERNDLSNAGAGVYFKDYVGANHQVGNVVRRNRIHDVSEAVAWSLTGQGTNYIHGNLCLDCNFGLTITGGGPQPDWVFANTFVNMASAGLYLNTPTGADGGFKAYGNIWVNCPLMIAVDGTMPARTQVDLQHNVYFTFTNFCNDSLGNLSFAAFKAAYPGQDVALPASVNSDPLFTNAGAGDYTLQVGSPARALGVDIGDLDGDGDTTEPCQAGCYQTQLEVIGVS